jgi:hypothetical protein
MAREIGIPEFGNWDADEDEEKGNGDDPRKDEGSDEPCHLLEVGNAEDSVVHEQETQLRPAKVPSIENFSDH